MKKLEKKSNDLVPVILALLVLFCINAFSSVELNGNSNGNESNKKIKVQNGEAVSVSIQNLPGLESGQTPSVYLQECMNSKNNDLTKIKECIDPLAKSMQTYMNQIDEAEMNCQVIAHLKSYQKMWSLVAEGLEYLEDANIKKLANEKAGSMQVLIGYFNHRHPSTQECPQR